jgi:hypothetical protein
MTTAEVMELAREALERRERGAAPVVDPSATHPYTIGANYLIRTVTMIDVGRIAWVGEHEIVLEDAAWIADTGRYHEIVQRGNLDALAEVEPYRGLWIVGRGAIVDACPWLGALPRGVK